MRSIRGRPEAPGLVLALALGLGLLGCSGELAAPIPAAHGQLAEPIRGGTVTLATFGDVRSIDPANIVDGLSPQIIAQLFAGLIDYDADGKIVPDLAERFTVDDDGKVYRFFLREGVRFHDGDEVTAADVKRSAERALHPSAPDPYSSYFSSLSGYAAFTSKKAEELSGIVVEGRYVVSFHLDQPDATFLPVLALLMLRPVCKSGGARYVDSWQPCGAGPFKLPPDAWIHGHSLRVVRHDGYFRPGLPHLDAVRWLLQENVNSQTFKFVRGDLDVIRDFATPDLLKFQADPRWRPFAQFDTDKQIVGESMNVEVPPFDNVEIRRAVAAAIDRKQIAQLRAANLHPTNQLVPPAVFGHDDDLVGQRFDLDAALEHMRRAGYPYDPATGQGGWPAVVPYVAFKQGLQEFTAQVLQQQLAKIGIRIEIRLTNYPTFMALRGRRKASAFGPGTWTEDFPDAISFLEPLFHSRSIADEDSNNWSFYANPRFDELVDRAKQELDEGRRKKLYDEAQAILIDDAPWAFTENFRWYIQRQPYLKGHRVHPMWMHELTHAWIDRAAGPVARRALFGPNALGSLLGAAR
jgi:ABC-type transport system substrate-binding protein